MWCPDPTCAIRCPLLPRSCRFFFENILQFVAWCATVRGWSRVGTPATTLTTWKPQGPTARSAVPPAVLPITTQPVTKRSAPAAVVVCLQKETVSLEIHRSSARSRSTARDLRPGLHQAHPDRTRCPAARDSLRRPGSTRGLRPPRRTHCARRRRRRGADFHVPGRGRPTEAIRLTNVVGQRNGGQQARPDEATGSCRRGGCTRKSRNEKCQRNYLSAA